MRQKAIISCGDAPARLATVLRQPSDRRYTCFGEDAARHGKRFRNEQTAGVRVGDGNGSSSSSSLPFYFVLT
jgi:hypothetical protein